MSLKEIKDSITEEKVLFGIKQALKLSKGKKKPKVFVLKDVRDETIKKLETGKVKFEVLGRATKEEAAQELGLDFESEVFTIK
jgi:ribosomal protein L30E